MSVAFGAAARRAPAAKVVLPLSSAVGSLSITSPLANPVKALAPRVVRAGVPSICNLIVSCTNVAPLKASSLITVIVLGKSSVFVNVAPAKAPIGISAGRVTVVFSPNTTPTKAVSISLPLKSNAASVIIAPPKAPSVYVS
ncbi:hypothetical protein Barb4_02247 [Bacteroidales bacterium Barb4]|nr:hypothetical protein Barb4_02247 [Bacteroidales bacterium Barb4]